MTIFDDWYMFMYNSLFTMAPLFTKALLQQDVNYKIYNDHTQKIDEINSVKVRPI